MPFTNREKPRLFERLRGKSGQDLLNEVKSAFNSDSRMLFDSPTWSNRESAFSRVRDLFRFTFSWCEIDSRILHPPHPAFCMHELFIPVTLSCLLLFFPL